MRALTLTFILFITSPTFAGASCGSLDTSAGPARYCRTGSGAAVLYLFHGHGSDERAPLPKWTKPFRTITISWGPIWFLKADKLAAFEREIVPALENGRPTRRLVAGGSLGGFNAYLAWSRSPHLFDAAVFYCPAFIAVDPFDVRSHKIDTLRAITRELRKHFDAKEWALYRPRRQEGLPPAYLIHNRDDELGFVAPDIAATIEITPGGHCRSVETPGLRAFISRYSDENARDSR